jgi:hypothetical protein
MQFLPCLKSSRFGAIGLPRRLRLKVRTMVRILGPARAHSMWWGILLLPYPVGWLMALAGGIAGLVRILKAKGQTAHA